MSVTYDWSPVTSAIQGLGQRMMYQKALEAMMGGQPGTTGVPKDPGMSEGPQLPTPPMTVNPGMIGGTQLPAQNIPSQPAPAPPPQMATPQAANNPYASMLPMLKYMDPSIGMPLLMQLQMKQAERQQNIQDRALKPMDPAKAKALGFKPGDVVYEDISGNPVVAEKSDMRSQGAIDQELALHKVTPITDPNDPRLPPKNVRPPGATYGIDAAGNVVENLKGDAKSPLAQSQAMAERSAAMEAQMRLYGLGGADGAGGFDPSKPLAGPYESVAKSIANYDRDESTALSRYPAPVRASIQARVQGINPDYRQQEYAASKSAQTNFASGKNGNTVRSLNVAISHLDTLGHLSDALGNGNLQVANSIGQAYAQQTGSPAPTNFDTAKQIVGDEITKAIIGTGGSQADRDKAQAVISRANSPAQLKGAINTYQRLLAGQLGGLRRQYEVSTKAKNFGDYLSPETNNILGSLSESTGTGQPNPGGSNKADPLGIR